MMIPLSPDYYSYAHIIQPSDTAVDPLEDDWLRRFMYDEQLAHLTEGWREALCEKEVQDFFDTYQQDASSFIVDKRIFLSEVVAEALQNSWVRKHIACSTYPLTWEQLAKLTWGGCNAFADEGVRGFLDQNWNYIEEVIILSEPAGDALGIAWVREHIACSTYPLTWEQLAKLTSGGLDALGKEDIREFLKNYDRYIDDVLVLSEPAAEALQSVWVQKSILEETNFPLTWKHLAKLTEGGCDALCNDTIQTFLEDNQFIDNIIVISRLAAKALQSCWVQQSILGETNFPLNWEHLAKLTVGGCDVLCNVLIQAFLAEFIQNQVIHDINQFIHDIIVISKPAAKALQSSVWVKKSIAGGTAYRLTWEHLAKLTEGGCDALCNDTIQAFLDEINQNQFIHDIIVISKPAAKALQSSVWVRKSIAGGTYCPLTLKHLAKLTEGGCNAICDEEIQRFIEEYQCIDQIIVLSERTAEALQDSWVRNYIVENRLKWPELTKLTQGGFDVLCNKQLRTFLLEAKGWDINWIIGLPRQAAKALLNSWINRV